MALRFLLDEDLSPRIAEVARGLSLDMVSVHELDRTGLADEKQLRFAAAENRILVTRNRDDFIALTKLFFSTNEPHAGVLIVSGSFGRQSEEAVAHAVKRWEERFGEQGPGKGFVDFI